MTMSRSLQSLLRRRKSAPSPPTSVGSSSFFDFQPATLALATVIAGAAGLSCVEQQQNEDASDANSRTRDNNASNLISNSRAVLSNGNATPTHHVSSVSILKVPPILATSAAPITPNNNATSSSISTTSTNPSTKAENYDFIIVGNGNAGQSALRTLRALCPSATIAVIDPKLPTATLAQQPTEHKFTTRIQQAVNGLNHSQRTLKLSDGQTLHFRQSILLATGARGAPPPKSLVDEAANMRLLELRSTEPYVSWLDNATNRHRRPVMHAGGVRQMTLLAASQGARICVMGSGLDALELVVAASQSAAEASGNVGRNGKRRKKRKNGEKASDDDDAKVTLLFGGAGILSTRLPRYLSTAVAKRLRQYGTDVQSRSLVRYVAMHSYNGQEEECEIHTAKSYDTMDTRRTKADLIVLAPTIGGQRGTAVVPIADAGDGSSSIQLPSAFTPWSSLSSAISCYVDDGRIVVNSELSAASRIYAAGSVAKYPSPGTGHASVSGEGVTDASLAGEVAAHNMARDYEERTSSRSFGFSQKEGMDSTRLFSSESYPIWRTDVCTYGAGIPSSLSSMGINALCVGNCDSETMATHGFFWTNQTADNRRRNTLARATRRSTASNGADAREDETLAGKLVRHRSTNRSSTLKRSVYGSGVVFYLDRAGSIRGIMTWGLPFTTVSKDGDSTLNPILLQRIKEIIRTNGEITKDCHRDAVLKRDGRLDSSLLSSHHLSEESKLLASIALSPSVDTPAEPISTQPLHRYVPSKPATITSIGMLKRRDEIGTGGVGEDLFARIHNDDCSEDDRPPSLVHVYPMNWGSGADPNSYWTGGSIDASAQQDGPGAEQQNSDPLVDYEATKRAMKIDEVRSRPPKEDPLWMREGDASRSISMNDVLTDIFLMQVRRGRFQDGSDSVKQAPTPKIIEEAKAKIQEWTSGDDDEEEDED